MAEPRHYVVLGAGIVGACAALRLRQEGFRVTLIDREAPGSGCSYGNAGILQIGGVVPVATGNVLRQVPRMLTDKNGALVIRWPYLPRLLPYLSRFVLSARPSRVEAATRALSSLLQPALPEYDRLINDARAHHLVQRKGELYVYRSERAYAAAQWGHGIRRAMGVKVEDVSAQTLSELEPALSRDLYGGVLLPDCWRTTSPQALTQAAVDALVQAGGAFLREEVVDVTPGVSKQIRTRASTLSADGLVIAAGAYSVKWARRFGDNVPMDTERGYHVTIPEQIPLRHAVVFGDHRIGCTAMTDGLRIAGTAELASLDAPPNPQRAQRLLPLAKSLLPGLRGDEAKPWMGRRPSTPDSLPVIGRATTDPDVLYAFGHGHLGLTMGAITGALVADLAAHRTPRVDLQPFRVNRF